jgi:hypothetical protein
MTELINYTYYCGDKFKISNNYLIAIHDGIHSWIFLVLTIKIMSGHADWEEAFLVLISPGIGLRGLPREKIIEAGNNRFRTVLSE